MAKITPPDIAYDRAEPDALARLGLDDPNRDGVVTRAEFARGENAVFADFYRGLDVTDRSLLRSFTPDNPLGRAAFTRSPAMTSLLMRWQGHQARREIILDPGYPTPETIDAALAEGLGPEAELFRISPDALDWRHAPLRHTPYHAALNLAGLAWETLSGGRMTLVPARTETDDPRPLGDPEHIADRVPESLPSTVPPILTAGRASVTLTFPDEPRRFSLLSLPVPGGRVEAYTLIAEAGAKISSSSEAIGGRLETGEGRPILRFEGLRLRILNVATASGSVNEGFPYEDITPLAVTIAGNRPCLVLTGEASTDDLIKPLAGDLLLMDLSPFLKTWLFFRKDGEAWNKLLFDAEGDLRPDVPIGDLRGLLIEAFTGNQTPAVPELAYPPGFRASVRGEGISLELNDVAAEAGERLERNFPALAGNVALTSLYLEDGAVRAELARHDGIGGDVRDVVISGRARLRAGLVSPFVDPQGDLLLELRFHYDTLAGGGYAAVKLPDVGVSGFGAGWDGVYGGEILVALDAVPDMTETALPGELLKTLTAQAFAGITRDGEPFLSALARLRAVSYDSGLTRIFELFAEGRLAFTGDGDRLAAIVSEGTLTEVDVASGDVFYRSLVVTGRHEVAGGLTHLFGEGVELEIRLREDGSFVIRPLFATAEIRREYEVSLERGAGELVVTPVRDGDGEIAHYRITANDLAVNMSDALMATGGMAVRGRTNAVLNGSWQSRASDIPGLLAGGKTWLGEGRLTLRRTDNELFVIDSAGRWMDFDTTEIASVFEIGAIELSPLKGHGRLVEKIKSGRITYAAPGLEMTSTVKGSVEIAGRYPLVRIRVLELIGKEGRRRLSVPAATPSAESGEQRAPETAMEGEIARRLAPVVSEQEGSNLLSVNPAFFFAEDFPLEAALASLPELGADVEKLPVMPGLPYRPGKNGAPTAAYPLFSGLWRFLNPRFEEGTSLVTEGADTLVAGGRLNDFRLNLTRPVRFLGMTVTGFGVADGRLCGGTEKHLYVYTPNGRRDLLRLLHLVYRRRLRRVYEKTRSAGIPLRRGAVPNDTAGLAVFLRALSEVFELEKGVREDYERSLKPFTPYEFRRVAGHELARAWEKIIADGPPLDVPERKDAETLVAYLNAVSERGDFAEFFGARLEVFPEATRGSARGYLRELHRLQRLAEKGDTTPREARDIQGYRRLVTRLLIRPYLPSYEWLDLAGATLSVTARGSPRAGDYRWLAFTRDAETPVTASLRLDRGSVRIRAALGPGEEITDTDVRLVSPGFLVHGRVESLKGLDLSIVPAGPDGGGSTEVSLGAYRARDMELTVMSGEDKPDFALFPASGSKAIANRIAGGGLYLMTRTGRGTVLDLEVGEFAGGAGSLYFATPLKRADGTVYDRSDALMPLAGATLTDGRVTFTPRRDPTDPRSRQDTVLTGNLDFAPSAPNEPRLTMFAGRGEDGTRRYLAAEEIVASGRLDIVNENVRFAGSALIETTPPEGFADDPAIVALRRLGVDLDIRRAAFRGPFELAIDGRGVRLQRLPLPPGGATPPATLTLEGGITITHDTSRVTLSEITLPVDEFVLGMLERDSVTGNEGARGLVRLLKIPPGEAVTGGIAGEVILPSQYEIEKVRLDDAHFSLNAASGWEFGLEGPRDPRLKAPGGVRLKIADDGRKNVLDLSTGAIAYADGNGEIREWRLDARLRDLIRDTVVRMALEGEASVRVTTSSDTPRSSR